MDEEHDAPEYISDVIARAINEEHFDILLPLLKEHQARYDGQKIIREMYRTFVYDLDQAYNKAVKENYEAGRRKPYKERESPTNKH